MKELDDSKKLLLEQIKRDEEELNYYEKLLGIKKGKALPEGFKKDGLDELIESIPDNIIDPNLISGFEDVELDDVFILFHCYF